MSNNNNESTEINEKRAKLQELLRQLMVWEGDFTDIQKSFSRLRTEFLEFHKQIEADIDE